MSAIPRISDSGYYVEYDADPQHIVKGPACELICDVSNAEDPMGELLDMDTSNLFTIFNLKDFVWTKKNTTTPDYIPGTFMNSYIHKIENSNGISWIKDLYFPSASNNTSTSSTIYILDENFSYKVFGNDYETESGEKIHIGLYPLDYRFDYGEISNYWTYEEKGLSSNYSVPRATLVLNNTYSYEHIRNRYLSILKSDIGYTNKYSDGTLIPPLNKNELNTYLSNFDVQTNVDDILPSEFVGSKFWGSAVIDYDASISLYPSLSNLMNDNVGSEYDISDYNWQFTYVDGSNWYRRCKYLINKENLEQLAMPKIYHLAFLYFAYYSSNSFISKLKSLNICRYELDTVLNTDSSDQSDNAVFNTFKALARTARILSIKNSNTHLWRNNRYLVTNTDRYSGSCINGASTGLQNNMNIDGIPPIMVTRIGKTVDNKLYMIYDVPLIPNHTTDTSNGGSLLYTINKNDIADLLQTILDGNEYEVGGNVHSATIDKFHDFRSWIGEEENYTIHYLKSLISQIRESSARNISEIEFIDWYRAAVGTVWKNMPRYYNKPYGTKVYLSDEHKLLTNEFYIAINAPGAGGGHGEYNNPDDYIAHGGNAGSAAVFKINIPRNNIADDSILCNIYSIGLGGDPSIMSNYNNEGTHGTYAKAGNSGSGVLFVGHNCAYAIPGGFKYPYNNDTNEAYNYDQSDNDNNEMQHISNVLTKRNTIDSFLYFNDSVWKFDVKSDYNLAYANISLITSSKECQTGNLLAIKPYPNVKFTNNKIDLMTSSGDELDILSGLDTSKTNYNKWTCGVYKHGYSTGSKFGTYFKAYRPGTPPITTDIINNIDDPMHECSAAYAGNSIFYSGGSTIFEAAAGDADNRSNADGEYIRENIIREYVDGRAGSGGGGLSDSTQNNGFLRSGKGGSMAFQLFWYSSSTDTNASFK